ncbi:FGGY-family carbohydrate kinase [Rugosimonospora acidiphila]|uniref:FGGY-family carbohydrate kinase n=1 Tax=Rugosimonospora acidiphila TaxID=556531 RepID=UPI0031EB92B0
MDAPYVIGVDAGTTVTKAVAFGIDGTQLCRIARPTQLNRPAPGRYEQDTDQVVASVVEVLAALAARLAGRRALAVGVTGQGDGLWLVDPHGRPVRPAMSWLDARAAPIVSDWSADGRLVAAYRRTGGLMFSGSAGPLLAWLDAHEPGDLAAAATAGYCKDVVLQRLTGVRATDVSDASLPFLDPHTRDYDASVLDLLGLARWRHLLAPVRSQPAGELRASGTGLPAGTPVIAGPYDLPASAWGAGVSATGDGLLIVGTTLACQVLRDRVDTGGEPSGLTISTWEAGRWLRALPAMVGTAALDWVLRLVGVGIDRLPALLSTGRADGLTVLPFFAEAGERAPFVEPNARARIDGMHLGTEAPDLVRATAEAIAYSARHCLTEAGLTGEVTACGGGVRSAGWAQIFADVLGRPVRVLTDDETGARGAALAALRVIGEPPLAHAPTGHTYEPDPATAGRYQDGYARYLDHLAQARAGWAHSPSKESIP